MSRASTSSRIRKTEDDFEAALRDHQSTIFLHGGPKLGADSPGPSTTPKSQARRDYGFAGANEEDLVDRSFDEDLYGSLDATPRKDTTAGALSRGNGAVNNGGESHSPASKLSIDSGTRSRKSSTPSKLRKPMQSMGLDDEINKKTEAEASSSRSGSKRRSLFRSPGTASSPDLATLVKKAKDRRPLERNGDTFRPDSMEKGRTSSVSSSGGLGIINERRESHEGTVRTKAKGVFGRMFGTRDPSPRAFPNPPDQPVPPIPSAFRESRTALGSVPESSRPATPPRPRTPTPTEKPLPSRPPQTPGSPSPAGPSNPSAILGTTRSHHTRQPAYSVPDSPSDLRPDPPRKSFQDDINGMLADIGHTSPARELGLSPDSVTLSAATGKRADILRRKSSPRYQQAELGVQNGTSRDLDTRSPVAPQRTTSLPANESENAPVPAPRSATNDTTLSSAKAFAKGIDASNGSTTRQRESSGAETVRAAPTPQLESPLAPSVRLVHSPRINSFERDREKDQLAVTTEDIAQSHYEPAEELIEEGETAEERGRKLACEFLEGDFSHVAEDKVAEFLGGPKLVNSVALRYYMQYFSMKGNLVDCFRELCQKLVLRAESQEIDRIIESFSARFYECNPSTVFGSPGVVHTVTGAMLMLNTDLHIADLSKHMSRSDFIRNALNAIRESMPESNAVTAPATPAEEPVSTLPQSSVLGPAATIRPTNTQRSASAPVTNGPLPAAGITRIVSEAGLPQAGSSQSSLNSSSFTYTKAWEVEAENALRDIYNAVRSEKILLPTNSLLLTASNGHSNSTSNRQSMISLANSFDSRKGTGTRSPSGGYKRASVIGRPGGVLNSVYSGDGRMSPTGSYANSINDTLQPFASIGFASNLSHTVIKEHEDEIRSTTSAVSVSTVDELNDDELALLGAPWAKEGLLEHKLHMESAGKRVKKGDWKQLFVVVQKGELYMFVFGSGSGFSGGGSVGGGNWLSNAKPVGTIDLIHCLATAIPKGSSGADRAHCFSLTSATGQITFFQAGTDDLVAEWVTTCNYWSARQSRQPLAGGVSNMEYGWQRVMPDPTTGVTSSNSGERSVGIGSLGALSPGTGSSGLNRERTRDHDDRASIRSARSGMSKLTFGMGTYGRSLGKSAGGGSSASAHPMDRVFINDWKQPIPALVPSTLEEEQQLEALQAYLGTLVGELEIHRALEQPMIRQYSTGSKNASKARENWRARSYSLHSETKKYETYIESLKSAIKERVKQAGEKKLEKSLARSNASLTLTGVASRGNR